MGKIIVDANKRKFSLNLAELIEYRDLFLILAYRDLRVRYSQTFLGLLWAILQPVVTLLIFVLVFGRAIKIDTGDIPYPVFAISGMAAWTYFSFVSNQSGTSLIGAQEMIKKIYFPRLVIPLSKALVGLVDFIIVLILMIALMLYYNLTPPITIFFLPIFIILTIISSLAVGIWLSALTIRYRDFQHVVPFLIQFGLYATPIAYPASIITDSLPVWAGVIFYLNPMAGVVEGMRWSLFGGEPLHALSYISFFMVTVLFVLGLFYFKRVERIMADIV